VCVSAGWCRFGNWIHAFLLLVCVALLQACTQHNNTIHQ
jgi:hypothetical protein